MVALGVDDRLQFAVVRVRLWVKVQRVIKESISL
jgi:hypothetical protein